MSGICADFSFRTVDEQYLCAYWVLSASDFDGHCDVVLQESQLAQWVVTNLR